MANKGKRVISPFLTIYKPQVTSMFSIMERITGMVLVIVGILVIMLLKLKEIMLTDYWFYSIVYGVFKSGGIGSIIISGLVICVIFKFYYHLLFGLRYMYWDSTGGGTTKEKKLWSVKMELDEVYNSSYILLGISVVATIMTWVWLLA